MEDMELPPMPQACDITPVSWSNLFSGDQMRDYARRAVLRERERNKALMEKCADIAEWHIADRDECGVLAREVYEAIRKGSQ